MTLDEYNKFAAAIRAGGFFTNGVRQVGPGLYLTVVCGDGPEILGGNSFWVTRLLQTWYFGTWGAKHYICPDHPGPVVVSLACLKREPIRILSEFEQSFISEYGLVSISVEEFESRAAQAGWFDQEDGA